jgi:hypothetical protein
MKYRIATTGALLVTAAWFGVSRASSCSEAARDSASS